MHAACSDPVGRHEASIGITKLFIDANLGVYNVDLHLRHRASSPSNSPVLATRGIDDDARLSQTHRTIDLNQRSAMNRRQRHMLTFDIGGTHVKFRVSNPRGRPDL